MRTGTSKKMGTQATQELHERISAENIVLHKGELAAATNCVVWAGFSLQEPCSAKDNP